MAIGIAEALKVLDRFVAIDAPPKRARDILVLISIDLKWHSNATDAQDAADRWERKFLKRVAEEIAYWENLGRVVQFAINSSAGDMLQGAGYVEPSDSQTLQDEKKIILRSIHYINFFKTMTANDFESLCAGLLGELGVEKPKITPQSRDEGIDFYGRLSLEKMMRGVKVFPGIEKQFAVWLVGQAKHFQKGPVSTLNIRELVGAVILARTRTFSTRPEARYSDLIIRPSDPVFCLFVTTGEFSNDALALIEKTGVIAMDGRMVATFLSERGIGIDNGAFNSPTMTTWIGSCATLSD